MHSLSIKVIHLRCSETQTQEKKEKCVTHAGSLPGLFNPVSKPRHRLCEHLERREAVSWKHRVRFGADKETIGRKVPDLLLFGHLLVQTGQDGQRELAAKGTSWSRRETGKCFGRSTETRKTWEQNQLGRDVWPGGRKSTTGVETRKSNLKWGVPILPLVAVINICLDSSLCQRREAGKGRARAQRWWRRLGTPWGAGSCVKPVLPSSGSRDGAGWHTQSPSIEHLHPLRSSCWSCSLA